MANELMTLGMGASGSSDPAPNTTYTLTDGQTWTSTFNGTVKIVGVCESDPGCGGDFVSDVFPVFSGTTKFTVTIGAGRSSTDTTVTDQNEVEILRSSNTYNNGTDASSGIGPQVINAGAASGNNSLAAGGGGGGAGGPLSAGTAGADASGSTPGAGGAGGWGDSRGSGGNGAVGANTPGAGVFPGGAPGKNFATGSGAYSAGTVVITVVTNTAFTPASLPELVASPVFAVMLAAGKLWKDTSRTQLATSNGDTISAFQCTFTGNIWTAIANPGTLYSEGSGKWSIQAGASGGYYTCTTIPSITSEGARCNDTGITFIGTLGCSNGDQQNFRKSTDDGWSRDVNDLVPADNFYVNGVNTDVSSGTNEFETVMGSSSTGSQSLPSNTYEFLGNSSQSSRSWVGRVAGFTLTDAVMTDAARAALKTYLDALA